MMFGLRGEKQFAAVKEDVQDKAWSVIICSPASAATLCIHGQVLALQTARQELQAALDDDDEARTRIFLRTYCGL